MKNILILSALIILSVADAFAGEVSVDLRFEPTASVPPSQSALAAVRSFKGVKVYPFTDRRPSKDTLLGAIKGNGGTMKVLSRTAPSEYASDAFVKLFSEWGCRITSNGPLSLKGEVTQFEIEEGVGYQARIGVHFYLIDDADRVIWDGHSSSAIKATGKSVAPENISGIFSDVMLATYSELLEDEKLVGVWSGRVPSTYVARD